MTYYLIIIFITLYDSIKFNNSIFRIIILLFWSFTYLLIGNYSYFCNKPDQRSTKLLLLGSLSMFVSTTSALHWVTLNTANKLIDFNIHFIQTGLSKMLIIASVIQFIPFS